MKSSLSFVLVGLAMSSAIAWSKCDVDQIQYYRSTSFGLNLGEGSSVFNNDITVNIPLVIDGKPACYHQKNSLKVVTEKVKDSVSVDYEITPLNASFEN